MSHQLSIDTFFKSKSSLNPSGIKIMNENTNVAKKRRSLSLTKTPTVPKTPKLTTATEEPDKKDAEVICLSSDDENASSPTKLHNLTQSSNKSDGASSNASQTTIIYSLTPQTPVKTPQTPVKTPQTTVKTPQTTVKTPETPGQSPQKTPLKTPQSTSSTSQSPQKSSSSKKYYSPSKKRSLAKRNQAKRNLSRDYFIQPNGSSDHFDHACKGMDDKTIFLLQIINKYLRDPSIKHLLTEQSQTKLSKCFQIIKPGIRLVCRLYWRLHGWYRREQLLQISGDKKPINEPTFQAMMNSLILNGFITPSADVGVNSLSFEEYAKILKADEIKQICKELKLKFHSKQEAIVELRAFRHRIPISQYFTATATTTSVNNAKRVIEMMKAKAGPCYKLSDSTRHTFFNLYLLMYLGMNYSVIRDKQLELVLINEKINRETYPVDKQMELDSVAVVFRDKDDFAEYQYAQAMHENYVSEKDVLLRCKKVPKVYKLYNEIQEDEMMRYNTLPEWLRRFTSANIYVKLLETSIQDLKREKEGNYQLMLDILTTLIDQMAFRQHKKAEWYAEKALILHKFMMKHDEAAKVLIEGLTSNLPDESKEVMRPRARNLAKQKNIVVDPTLKALLEKHASEELILEVRFNADHVSKQPMENYKQRGKKKFEIHTEHDKQFLNCEDYCIIHYTTQGSFTHGAHWEGRIVTTIFYLLFWNIIYTKPVGVAGIFLSYYQLFPLDMFTESFYTNRKAVIDERLKRIESMAVDTLVETMRLKWEERPEHELSGINRTIGWDNIRMVADCLGAKATGAICRRLAINYGYAHSGFPDLTLWNAATKKIKFVEVKTDSDKPSIKQLQWMQYLVENGIDAGFCYVGANTTRCRARSEPSARSMKDTIQFECSPPFP